MTNELLAMIAIHFACADISEQRRLSGDEIRYCSGVYENIKLAFMETDPHTYATLTNPERAAISKGGFRAFYDWQQANPGLVRHLQNVARGEAELGIEG